jgi:hypothetical protein
MRASLLQLTPVPCAYRGEPEIPRQGQINGLVVVVPFFQTLWAPSLHDSKEALFAEDLPEGKERKKAQVRATGCSFRGENPAPRILGHPIDRVGPWFESRPTPGLFSPRRNNWRLGRRILCQHEANEIGDGGGMCFRQPGHIPGQAFHKMSSNSDGL